MYTISPSRRGQLTLQRSFVPAERGLIGFTQRFTGSDTRVVITHEAALVTRVEVLAGRLTFPLTSGEVCAGERFSLFLPPRSVMPMCFDEAEVISTGAACFGLDAPFGAAILRDQQFSKRITKAEVSRLSSEQVLRLLNADEGIAPLLIDARQEFHNVLAHPSPVRHVARSLEVPVETLCRGFSRSYGISPKQYCHRARLFEAVLRLAAGATIVESAFTAGFGDLKRFYEQFRRIIGVTPGEYARVKKRQDEACRLKV